MNHLQETVELRTLSEEELLFERARSASIALGAPTRVRYHQVEALLGDTWVHVIDTPAVPA